MSTLLQNYLNNNTAGPLACDVFATEYAESYFKKGSKRYNDFLEAETESGERNKRSVYLFRWGAIAIYGFALPVLIHLILSAPAETWLSGVSMLLAVAIWFEADRRQVGFDERESWERSKTDATDLPEAKEIAASLQSMGIPRTQYDIYCPMVRRSIRRVVIVPRDKPHERYICATAVLS